MADQDWYAVRLMTEAQERDARGDLTLIIRGEDRDLTWGRLRTLLDHELAEISYPVMTQGSVRSLNPTDKGLRFLGVKEQ